MDESALRSAYRFGGGGVGGGEVQRAGLSGTWGSSLAATYDAALTKDFALAAFGVGGRLGLRWRTRREVINGKGQFICGALDCDGVTSLSTYEVPFQYEEAGISTAALVRLRLCGTCASIAFLTATPPSPPLPPPTSIDITTSTHTTDSTAAAFNTSPSTTTAVDADNRRSHHKHRRRKRRHFVSQNIDAIKVIDTNATSSSLSRRRSRSRSRSQ